MSTVHTSPLFLKSNSVDSPGWNKRGSESMDPSLFPQRTYAQQQHASFDHAHAPEAASPRDQLQIPVRMALDAFIQHNAGLTPADIGTLMAHLEQLMRDCSEANIQVDHRTQLSPYARDQNTSATRVHCTTTNADLTTQIARFS